MLHRTLLHVARGGRCARFTRCLSALPDHKELTMPKVSPTMTHGRFIEWKKKQGEKFVEGEDIAEVESDKSTMPIAAREDGYIARILVDPDTPDLPLGTLLAITVEEEQDIAAFKDYVAPVAAGHVQDDATASTTGTKTATTSSETTKGRKYEGPIGPAVARLLNMHPNLDLALVNPTGPKGRILKGDVLTALADGSAVTKAINAGGDDHVATTQNVPMMESHAVERHVDVPVSSMRRAIARSVVHSKREVAHEYLQSTYELDALLELRARMNSGGDGVRVSVNDLMIHAAAVALHRVPAMNVQYDSETGNAIANASIDVCFAVAVPDGLLLPVLFGADRLGARGISTKTKDLVSRARAGTLEPHEYDGGSIGISNLGMFGIDHFCAIINTPQSGMLAIGSAST